VGCPIKWAVVPGFCLDLVLTVRRDDAVNVALTRSEGTVCYDFPVLPHLDGEGPKIFHIDEVGLTLHISSDQDVLQIAV
jgi:hypothetical protein